MDIIIDTQESVKVVKIAGNIDGTTAQEVQDKVVPFLINGAMIVFDMAECPYVSSAGLRVLLVIAKKLANIGGRGAMAAVVEEVKDVMEMTGFDNIFKTYQTVAEAVEAVKKEE